MEIGFNYREVARSDRCFLIAIPYKTLDTEMIDELVNLLNACCLCHTIALHQTESSRAPMSDAIFTSFANEEKIETDSGILIHAACKADFFHGDLYRMLGALMKKFNVSRVAVQQLSEATAILEPRTDEAQT